MGESKQSEFFRATESGGVIGLPVRRRLSVFSLPVLLLVFSLALIAGGAVPVQAQQPAAENDSYGVVSFDGKRLFSIETSIGPVSALERARDVVNIMDRVQDDEQFVPGLVSAKHHERYSDVSSGTVKLLTVTEGDANVAGSTHEHLASIYAKRIADAIEKHRQKTHAPQMLFESLKYAAVATAVMLSILVSIAFVSRRIYKTLAGWKGKYIKTVRIQSAEIVREDTLYAVLRTLLRLVSTVATWVVILTYAVTVLGVFPQTEHLAFVLKDQIFNGLVKVVWPAIIGYMPNLFVIAVVAFATRYLLKGVKFAGGQLEKGTITIPGFENEWISPTANIIRFLIVVFALMLVFPYLPGSGSPAFQQVAIFLGVLVSLGSSGAVSHIISGIFLTYTGAFRLNDRVQIADTVGDVVARSLLATRVRTIKQEYITVPNGLVLGSHIVNYSSSGSDPGLILHTTVTLGYDVAWRQAHDLLIDAALATEDILKEPKPFVLQTSLDDFSVAYQVNAYTNQPSRMAAIYSELHQNIQDSFAAARVEILSPAFRAVKTVDGPVLPEMKPPD